MTGKRPYEANGAADEHVKRQRTGMEGETELERKKRETAEKMAALKAKIAANKPGGGGAAAPSASAPARPGITPPPLAPADEAAAKQAEAKKKIAEIKARMAAKAGASPMNGAAAAATPPPQSQQMTEQQRQMAEARARAAEIARKPSHASPAVPAPQGHPRMDGRGARGGLGIGLHPSLMGDPSADRGKGAHQGPKFSTVKGNREPERPKLNPYLADAQSEQQQQENDDLSFAPTARRYAERKSKQLVFSQKGKYMAQANALRQQARLEEMKRRIAAETRKAEIEEASDKSFLAPAPPEIEWWDEGLLPEGQNSYEDWEAPGRNKIETEDSIITALIQRPVLLQAAQDKFLPGPKPLMLTTKEQKKLRRQRRMADMKEEQAKIRLGLIEPPPPKVKKSNMMRVLGEQAVKDPTAVEARVNREIAQRANDHEKANAERALTAQQRAEKLKQQQAGDEAKGVKVAVFRVDDLSSGKHRYQVDVNAKQNALTGIVVLHPTMNLIIVEGGAHSINAYKKLMLKRVKWQENTAPPPDSEPTTFTGFTDGSINDINKGTRGQGSKAQEWCHPLDQDGNLKDLSKNRCLLVWEGEEAARVFKRWGSRACETDGEAKDVLSKTKMENMWTLARNKKPEFE